MRKETMRGVTKVSEDAVIVLQKYFHDAIEKTDDSGSVKDQKLPDRALTMLGRLNGMESTRLKAIALNFQIAKSMGLQGEMLRPLLEALSPESFASGAAQAVTAGGESEPPQTAVEPKTAETAKGG